MRQIKNGTTRAWCRRIDGVNRVEIDAVISFSCVLQNQLQYRLSSWHSWGAASHAGNSGTNDLMP